MTTSLNLFREIKEYFKSSQETNRAITFVNEILKEARNYSILIDPE